MNAITLCQRRGNLVEPSRYHSHFSVFTHVIWYLVQLTVCMSWTIIHGRRLKFKFMCWVPYRTWVELHGWYRLVSLFCGRRIHSFWTNCKTFSTDIHPTHCTLAMSLLLSDQGYYHQLCWSGFNPTTFQGINHISACQYSRIRQCTQQTGWQPCTWPQLTELEIDGFK